MPTSLPSRATWMLCALLLPAAPAWARQSRKPEAMAPSRDRIGAGFDRLDRERPTPDGPKGTEIDTAFAEAESSRAANLAESAVNALDDLSRTGAETIEDLARSEARLDQLSAEIRALREARDRKLEEYREGLFCSGCNRTRSEILARNETFPHPNQRIVRLGAEELRAKERELQAPIDRLASEIGALTEHLRQARALLDDVLEQLEAGHRFWRTALTFKRNLVLQDLAERIQAAREEEKQADLKLSLARAAQLRALGPDHGGEKRKADEAVRSAQGLLKAVEAKRRSDREGARQRLLRDRRIREAQERRIATFLARGKLHTRTTLSAGFAQQSITAGHPQLGGNFRMGRLRSRDAGTPETLPRVDQLIVRFHQTGTGALTEESVVGSARMDRDPR